MFIKLYLKELAENSDGIVNSLDIICSTIRYGASPINYKMFGFKNLTSKQRKTYVTNRTSRQMIKRYNQTEYIDLFENKAQFAETFVEFFGREWVCTDGLTFNEFKDFLQRIGDNPFICKPISGSQGQKIRVFDNWDDEKALFDEINKQ